MRIAIIYWSHGDPLHLSPRGQRSAHLAEALRSHAEIQEVGLRTPKPWLAGQTGRTRSSIMRRCARSLVGQVLMDKFEPSARRRLSRWTPASDGAVLIGAPFSPLPFAARRLAQANIPFAVDVGDPWTLTQPVVGRSVAHWRSARAERTLWMLARAVIVTTEKQGEALGRLFPHLRVLVRPNGYTPVANAVTDTDRETSSGPLRSDILRLVHYGSLYGARAELSPIFERLEQSGRWRKIIVRQHGPDWDNILKQLSRFASVECRPAISWDAVVREAGNYHAAIAIGWQDVARMPSKVVQYLTLPIPRIALANPGPADSLAQYVEGRPGWTTISSTTTDPASMVAELVGKRWTKQELHPPPQESWEEVEGVLRQFILEVLQPSPTER